MMMFDQEQKERIDRAIKYSNVRLILKDIGVEYKDQRNTCFIKCPTYTHREREPSCKVVSDINNKYKGIWHCFGCNASGTIIQLVSIVTQLKFWESVKYVEDRLGNENVNQYDKPIPYPMLPKEFISPKKSSDWNKYYINYLLGRGIEWWQIKKHKIGYCDEGYYKKRIIIPVNLGVHFATWIGRSIHNGQRVTSCYGGTVGLFGSEYAKAKNGPAIIVEGWADALKLERIGYLNVMALQTNIMKEVQFDFLKNFPYIICMPDNDNGGKQLQNSIGSYIEDQEWFIASLSQSKDAGEVNDDDEIHYAMEHLTGWEPVKIIPEVEIIY